MAEGAPGPDQALQLLGETIRAFRKQRRLTQRALAARVGLAGTYVSAIERGQRNVSIWTLLHIAVALQVPLSRLLQPLEDHPELYALPAEEADNFYCSRNFFLASSLLCPGAVCPFLLLVRGSGEMLKMRNMFVNIYIVRRSPRPVNDDITSTRRLWTPMLQAETTCVNIPQEYIVEIYPTTCGAPVPHGEPCTAFSVSEHRGVSVWMRILGLTRDHQQPRRFAALLNHLFETRLTSEGRPYTLTEVSKATGMSVPYLSILRKGTISAVPFERVAALARFFHVPLDYFSQEGPPVDTMDDLAREALAKPLVREVMLRAGKVGVVQRALVLQMLEHAEQVLQELASSSGAPAAGERHAPAAEASAEPEA